MSEIFFPVLTMPAMGLSEAGLVDATFLLSRDVITCSAPKGNSYIAHSPAHDELRQPPKGSNRKVTAAAMPNLLPPASSKQGKQELEVRWQRRMTEERETESLER